MTTNFTIVYVTEDQPAGNCLYGFNVRMWESISSFRNAIRSTCGELETGSISIENLELSPLAFQINVVFDVKFSGEGTETSRDICMHMIEIISNGNQNYLKPFSVISCNASHSTVTKKQTTWSAAFEYNCTEMLGSQPLASSGGVRCVPCFPGNYLNSTRCEPCLQGTYQAVPGQLICDVCPSRKHVTEDRTECLKYEYSTYNVDLEAVYRTNDAVAATCLSQFQAFTSAHRDYFQTNISTSCSELHDGNVTIENITIGSIAFQVNNGSDFNTKCHRAVDGKFHNILIDYNIDREIHELFTNYYSNADYQRSVEDTDG
uniref:Tyrosine-protein kinase ephrin type A/B receptor-like domain-containing protein n=1 Tax=Magallana gigas TaxID=29159 RepID=K1PU91_MAGGI